MTALGTTGRHGYPTAPRADIVDRVHGHEIADPYRPLENRDDVDTEQWLADQDALYASHLAGSASRGALAQRLAELHAVGVVGSPVWRGSRWFSAQRRADQELDTLCTGLLDGDSRVLLDLNVGDQAGTTSLDGWMPSRSGALLAYHVSRDGTEEPMLWVIDVVSGAIVDGPIDRTRHGSIAWLPDDSAFYYSRGLPPDEVPAGEEGYHRRVYLHRLGQPTGTDVLIFGDGQDRTCLYHMIVSQDGRWLIVRVSRGAAARNDIWLADLYASTWENPDLQAIQAGTDARTNARIGYDGLLYLLTDLGSPMRRLAVTGPAVPELRGWTDLVAEDEEAVLTEYGLLDLPDGGRELVLVVRSRHAISELTVHDRRSGEVVDIVRLPGLGAVSGLTTHPDGGPRVWFGYTDFCTPQLVLCYDARTRTVEPWRQQCPAPGTSAVEVRQIVFGSADGTAVRMLVLAPTGVLAGTGADAGAPRRTILHGYGGFNMSTTPAYAPAALAWVEAGGLYAVAALRGGGEEGQAWHRAGMREFKQNTFDDFYAAAEHLVRAGWTSPAQLCASGGSNGGLLVGAAITQRPDLFAAALCQAPLLDMVRYERSGLGRMWTSEYGSAADPGQLATLLAYSPYHHVRTGTDYPAVLFLTFEADTRVDGMHARKMCAALQDATSSAERPILLRREARAGHGVRAVSQSVALAAEKLAFALAYTATAADGPGQNRR